MSDTMDDSIPDELTFTPLPPDENPFLDSRATSGSATKKTSKISDVELIIRSLEKFYISIGIMVRIVDVQDSVTILKQAESLAESWRVLLESDIKVRRMMKNLIKGGGWGTVITAHLMVALPIMEHHGISPAKLFTKQEEEEAA